MIFQQGREGASRGPGLFWREREGLAEQEVEWGHQVGNLWPSFWCYPCVCFHNLIPGGTCTHTQIQSYPRAWTHTHTHWHKKKTFSHAHQKLEHCKVGIWTIFVNKLADVKRLWRQGFRGKKALIRMCCSYCVCFWVLWALGCQNI